MNLEDKRHYKRYRINAECEIKGDTQTYKGRVFDYSDGAGVVMDQSSQFAPGMKANLKIPDLGIEFRGEVAWTRNAGNYLRVGFARLGHFRKNLRNYKLPDILIGIQRSSKTGFLEIQNGPIVKNIYFKNGDIIFADSSRERDRLGELLLKEGKITLKEYNQASDIFLQTGNKIGKILVEMGLLTPSGLFKALYNQIEEIIMSLFEVEEGLFEFKEEPLLTEELITLQISTANIIYKGMKRIHDAGYIENMYPPDNAVLTLSQDPMNIFQSLTLEPADKDILYSVSKKKSLKAIVAESPLNNFETLRTVSSLFSIRFITVMREEGDSVELAIDEILSEFNVNTTEFLQQIDEMLDKCNCLGYYDILGVKKHTLFENIKKAYFRLSKEYHPDRHFSFPEHDIKSKLITILSYLTEAYETLSDPGKKTEYDKTSADKKIVGGENGPMSSHVGPALAKEGDTGIEQQESPELSCCKETESGTAETVIRGKGNIEIECIDKGFNIMPGKTAAVHTNHKKAVLSSPGDSLYIKPEKNKRLLYSVLLITLLLGVTALSFLYNDSQILSSISAQAEIKSTGHELPEKTLPLPNFRYVASAKTLQKQSQ